MAVEVKDLLEAGVHFGHLTRKWDPNMAPYVYMERNGIHIINLYKTAAKIEEAGAAYRSFYISPAHSHSTLRVSTYPSSVRSSVLLRQTG